MKNNGRCYAGLRHTAHYNCYTLHAARCAWHALLAHIAILFGARMSLVSALTAIGTWPDYYACYSLPGCHGQWTDMVVPEPRIIALCSCRRSACHPTLPLNRCRTVFSGGAYSFSTYRLLARFSWFMLFYAGWADTACNRPPSAFKTATFTYSPIWCPFPILRAADNFGFSSGQ